MEGEEEEKDDGTGAPAKPKKKSLSKGKKKKAVNEDKVEAAKSKTSAKVKGRLLLDEKIEIPPEITEHVEQSVEEGFMGISSELCVELAESHYRMIEKKKLIRFHEGNKMKVNAAYFLEMQ